MLKWLIVLLLTVLGAGLRLPRLAALLGRGRLPGDVSFRYRGRHDHFPFGTALLLSLLAIVLYRLL